MHFVFSLGFSAIRNTGTSRRIIFCHQQHLHSSLNGPRYTRTAYFIRGYHDFRRTNPQDESFHAKAARSVKRYPVLAAAIFIGSSALLITGYEYMKVLRARELFIAFGEQPYPESVAVPLWWAIFYSKYAPNEEKASEMYNMAIKAAEDEGLEKTSNEVLGIMTAFARMLEDNNHLNQALMIYERATAAILAQILSNDEKALNEAERPRLAKRLVRMFVKLSDLYERPELVNHHNRLVALQNAAGLALAEKARQVERGVEDQEALPDEEIGATLEALAIFYSQTGEWTKSLQYYERALNFCPPDDCHGILILNNSAQVLFNAEHNSTSPHMQSSLEQVQQLLRRALSWAASIPDSKRTVECNQTCVIVITNMAMIAEQIGDIVEARKLFKNAEELARKVGFNDVAEEARKGLEGLSRS